MSNNLKVGSLVWFVPAYSDPENPGTLSDPFGIDLESDQECYFTPEARGKVIVYPHPAYELDENQESFWTWAIVEVNGKQWSINLDHIKTLDIVK